WTSATVLGTYNLTATPGNVGPGAIFPAQIFGEQIFVPVAAQNLGVVNFGGIVTDSFFQFNLGSDSLLQPPFPFDGAEGRAVEQILNPLGQLTGTGVAGLNAISMAFLGVGFTGAGPGQDFVPDTTGTSGDTIQNLGFHADPIQSVVTVVLVPEIDPASMA